MTGEKTFYEAINFEQKIPLSSELSALSYTITQAV